MKALATTLLLTLLGFMAAGQSTKDIKANSIKSITTWQNDKEDDPSATYKDSYEVFNKKGNTVLKIKYKKDGSVISKQTCAYDKDQNLTEEFEYDGNSCVTSHKAYVYNGLGKKTEEIEYSPSGDIIKKTTNTYDFAGEKTSEIVTDAKGALLKKVVYTYNSRKLKTQRITSNMVKKVESIKKWAYEYY